MIQAIATIESVNGKLIATEKFEFTFVEDVDFELVGGGNAANCY